MVSQLKILTMQLISVFFYYNLVAFFKRLYWNKYLIGFIALDLRAPYAVIFTRNRNRFFNVINFRFSKNCESQTR